MKKKEFKAESKRLMDLMINSIYTNKDIFLREIISNSSDAMDKLYYKSLTDTDMNLDKDSLKISITLSKDERTITVSDNGCGMNKDELENNLGTIAKSGSFDFKNDNDKKDNIDIIGQFGVGFYSVFMVAKKVEVISKAYNNDKSYVWKSSGVDGYTIDDASKETFGTDVIITLKDDTDDDDYCKYLDEGTIKSLIKKYSDYITYPIEMLVTKSRLKEKKSENDNDEYEEYKETEILNSLIPIWKKDKKDVTDDEYNAFYSDKFFDYEKPLTYMNIKAEGLVSYNTLLFIPSHAAFDYYTKEYEKGLQLYSNGVLIMEKCSDLLPDYYSFVKGVVDSPDLPLNISREMLQQSKVLKTIATSVESKINKELLDMQKDEMEKYEKFYNAFGTQIKYGIYSSYGMNKDKLQDLLMFASSKDKKLTTLKKYKERMKEGQKNIYYACGETVDKIDLMPQVDSLKEKYEILYCTDYVDEFTIKSLYKYDDVEFKNVSDEDLNLSTKEEQDALNKLNVDSKDMLTYMKEALQDVKEVRFTDKLNKHPVCLTTEGNISASMEKVINSMPTDEKVTAEKILEINKNHPIVKKLNKLYTDDKDWLKNITKILYAEARLIEGLPIDNPTELSNLICDVISK